MQHRAVHKSILTAAEPLLPVQLYDSDAIKVTPKQLQQIGIGLLALLLLFVGANYFRHFQKLQRHDLSSCSDRLAMLGLELSAASLSGGSQQFAAGGAASDTNIWEHALQRYALYSDLASDMQRNGLALGGEVTQGLTQADLFERVEHSGHHRRTTIKPKLRHLDVPVRAVVLPLQDDEAAMQIHSVLKRALHSVLAPDAVWWQQEHLMHSTLWHASTYKNPVAATPQQITAEATAVSGVARSHCPIHAVLDRVVISSGGVVMACWQVLPGSTEVTALRSALQAALPQAPPPEKQTVRYPAILYTTIARLLSPARRPDSGAGPGEEWDVVWLQSALVDAVDDASDELCGLVATFGEVWYVEERDLLALALNGHYNRHASHLKCPSHNHQAAAAAA